MPIVNGRVFKVHNDSEACTYLWLKNCICDFSVTVNYSILFDFNLQIVVTNEDGTISVEFCSTHFSRSVNLGRCNLTPEERAMIAGYSTLHCI